MKPDAIQIQICNNVRKFRELRGLTREEFCAPLEVDASYWGTIERGERYINLPRLLQLCEVYNADLNELIPSASPYFSTTSEKAEVAALLEDLTAKQLDVVKKFILDIAPHI